ncbi:Flagellar protein FlgJ [peptidoglycan hydrolase] [hydrothermal vent metagenome]|uniref:Peptidoglycan hydrolase FlgJ n=1 Tax=hydrothermal vent metagenome TaxID=652676 RepID=A0A3B0YAZ5_9ZZZZ
MDKIDQNYQKAQVYTDGQGLSNLKLKAAQRSPEAIKGVAKQFEALFLQMMLKSMRDTQLGDGLFDSDQGKMYRDLFDKQIALKMSSNGSFGMAQLIERQLTQMTSGKTTSAPSTNPLMINAKLSGLTLGKNELSSLQIPTRLRAQVKQQVDKILKANNLNPDGSAITPSLNKTTDTNKIEQTSTYASPLEFAKAIWADVKVAAKKLGVSPVAMLAQTALETGWGKHVARNKDGSSSFNLFGIKAGSVWGGKQTTAQTSEYSAGKKIKLITGFRSYQNSRQSVADYSNLLQSNKRFSNVLKNGKSVAGFATAMQNSGYATDPQYAKKIMSIANGPTFRRIMQQLVK